MTNIYCELHPQRTGTPLVFVYLRHARHNVDSNLQIGVTEVVLLDLPLCKKLKSETHIRDARKDDRL
jgi:hypothetical protein